LNLTGFVLNSGHGVYEEHLVKVFEEKLNNEKPHESIYIDFDTWECEEIQDEKDFVILASETNADIFTFIPLPRLR